MPVRDLLLIRHAESQWNAIGRWQGQADPPLSEHGRSQATALATDLPLDTLDAVYCSDLQRAVETARPLAERYGVQPVVDSRLRELDVGSWTGLTRAEIAERQPGALELWYRGTVGWEGGESYDDHHRRCLEFVKQIATLDAERVALVSHGGTLRGLVMAFLELPVELRWRLAGVGHTSVTHLTHGRNSGYALRMYNGDPAGVVL